MARVVARFVRHLRRQRPHILHGQLYWANILSVVAGRLSGVPAVVTSRLDLGDEGAPPVRRLIQDGANRLTTAIFANSHAVVQAVLSRERVAATKIKVIYNGVAVDEFRTGVDHDLRRRLDIAERDLVVMVVAALRPSKGHEDLLRAAALLRPKYPQLRLVLAGRDGRIRPQLDAVIRELSMDGAVRLLGERTDIPALLRIADIVAHPSHQEGFSNAILEAMAAGRPLVVTRVGGNPEAVTDGREGFLVPPRDPAALANALDTLMADDALRQRMGTLARQRVETAFPMDRMISSFSERYEDLAAKGSR